MKRLYALVQLEFFTDLKNRYIFTGFLLYLISIAAILYLSMATHLTPPLWIALFWITLIFASVQSLIKTFYRESRGYALYLHTLASPFHIILAKMCYNSFLICLISFINLIVFIFLFGNPLHHTILFISILILGSTGIANLMTFLAAVASKSEQSNVALSVMSFPLLLPLLTTTIKASAFCLMPILPQELYKIILLLVSLNLVIIALALLLFPYLWAD